VRASLWEKQYYPLGIYEPRATLVVTLVSLFYVYTTTTYIYLTSNLTFFDTYSSIN
jgi:hypothetical protein